MNITNELLYKSHFAIIDEFMFWWRLVYDLLVQDNDEHTILLIFNVKQQRLKIVL